MSLGFVPGGMVLDEIDTCITSFSCLSEFTSLGTTRMIMLPETFFPIFQYNAANSFLTLQFVVFAHCKTKLDLVESVSQKHRIILRFVQTTLISRLSNLGIFSVCKKNESCMLKGTI